MKKAHLVMIYTDHVNACAAHAYECKLAPELENIKEYWPSPSHNKVRLPAGKYVRPGRVGWCTLYDARGQELSRDGQSAVRTLLEYQTPANFVSPESVLPAPEPPLRVQPQKHSRRNLKRDERSSDKNDHTRLWVAFTPLQLIDQFNQQYSIEDLVTYERSGMILADWRGERTASTRSHEGWATLGQLWRERTSPRRKTRLR